MERLTNIGSNGEIWITDNDETRRNGRKESAYKKLAEYEDFEEIFRAKMTDTACELLGDKEEFGKWLDRIEWIAKKCDEYARAEEQGLLLRLPCKVGTKVYTINPIIDYGEVGDEAIYYYSIIEREFQIYMMMDYGKLVFGRNVFLTKAEAEQKLKEMESD